MTTAVYYAEINLTCMLFLLIIRFCIPKDSFTDVRGKLYRAMIGATLILSASDLVAGVLRGATFNGARFLLWSSNILYVISIVCLAILWILFSSIVLTGKLSRKIGLIFETVGMVIIILNVMTPLHGLIFTLDANNYYHRGDLIWLNWAFIVPCHLLPVFYLPFSKANKREKLAICLYPIFSFVCSAIQFLNYGLSTGQVGMTASILTIYIFLQSDRIIEHKKKQEKLKEENLRSKNASEAKGRFLANVSHEIRTPINAVLGMDTMILRETKDPVIREYAVNIQNAGRTLLSLINDILDMSKIESGKLEVVPVQYELKELVNDVYNMVRFKAEAKGLKLNVELDEGLPNGLIGDDVRVRQILMNLLNNAVKYTENGSVTLSILGEENKEGVVLHVSIKDTGIGIKEEDMTKLFNEFARLEEARNRNVEGTGLGMSITMQLLSLMDSELEIDSVYGEGTEVYFDLFQGIYGSELVKDFSVKISDDYAYEEYEASFQASEAYVLVVDDNKVNRDVFCGLLKATKMHIDTAVDGKDALEKIFANKYDIVFLDHMMPEIDGIEVLSRVKATKNHPNLDTKFIALTANAVTGAKEMYLEAGFDAYLSKPIMPEDLEKMLRIYLPEEKKLISMNQKKQIAESSDSLEDIPSIEGIDWNLGLLHLDNKELLLKTVQGFYDTMDIEAKALMELYNKILDDSSYNEAIDQYRIKVHSMKSAANLIGIFPLAGTAAMLEYAARDNLRQLVIDVNPYFIELWNSYKEKLSQIAVESVCNSKLTIDKENVGLITGNINSIVELMHSFDVKAVDEIVEELDKYDFVGEMQQLFQELKGYVRNLDDDEVERVSQDILNILNSQGDKGNV